MIVDPTIRYEANENQPQEVYKEKEDIYINTINYYSKEYKISKFKVIGLLIGARGTIPKLTQELWKNFNLETKTLNLIALTAVKLSINIIRNHLYKNT